jgi:light-regulated signal transduction histidine kinase (bacteriophytochrome)
MAHPALNLSDEHLLGQPITLTNCDREPIHIPGLVQPFGFLLCLDEDSQRVVQASANTQELIGVAAESLLGQGLGRLLGPARLPELAALWPTLTHTPKLLGVRLDGLPEQPFYKLIVHRYDGLLWAEFEPVVETAASALDLPSLNTTLGQMLGALTVHEFCQRAVEQVRDITGFDRVMMYRFDEHDNGEVVAEAQSGALESFLGLHYPASDIPQQARLMYLKNWLRFIPDVAYVPAALVGRPTGTRPPDMTHAILRSVSPIHLEYLRNMGVAASMSISIVQNGRLWGMVLGHHHSPRLVSFELRELCVFIAQTFSALLATKEQLDTAAYQLRINQVQAQLFEQVTQQPNFLEGLHKVSPSLLDVFDCGGAAICFEGDIITLGHTPLPLQIKEVVAWLQKQPRQDVFHTNSYATLNPAGLNIRATASGILAITLSQEPGDYILWFRPELVHTVTWAGKNEKVETLANGQLHLSPRQSFAAWRQTVDSTAMPWQPLELEAARQLRLHIADVRLKVFNELQARATRLSSLNDELARSNDELDSFAYVASHDLKEPLRGIHNYSVFLLEDYAEQLDSEGVNKLQTLVRLSQRMETLIESLLQLSRVGRLELETQPTNPQELLDDVLDTLQQRLEHNHATVRVATPLPLMQADPVRLREVFNNLITNAMRYNDRPEKDIEVGVAPPTVRGPKGSGDPALYHVLYVKDNGIGINPRNHETIFRIFKRLHGPDKYGGGTGAGLAIARKMIEKHGGELWVDSVQGQGSTFYFSISKP